MWDAFRKHPVVAVLVSVAFVVGGIVGFFASLAAIWSVMSRDTVPEFLKKQGWAMTLPPWQAILLMVVSIVILGLQASLLREAFSRKPSSPSGDTADTKAGALDNQSPTPLPYPTIRIFRHKEARKHSNAVFDQIFSLFMKAGWRVEDTGDTNLPQHDNGIRVAGKAGYAREAAIWGLDTLGIKWIADERPNPPDILEVIVGRYDEPLREAMSVATARQKQEIVELKIALETATKARESIEVQLGQVSRTLVECRNEREFAKLSVLAWRDLREQPKKKITVRYLEFADNALADHIASIFRRATEWPTTVQRDSTSHLAQETLHRVVFESGNVHFVKLLADIFIAGNFIGEPVSPREIFEKQSDDPDVLITIFPQARV